MRFVIKRDVIRRAAVIGLALSTAAPLLAQQAPPALPAPATLPGDPVKPQVLLYESALRQAIDTAGQKLAARTQLVAPQVILQPDRLPDVRGIHLDDYGYYFDVLIPNINPVAMRVINTMKQNVPTPPLSTPVGVTAVPDVRVTAAGNGPGGKIIAPDPMTPALTLANFNPDLEYSAFSRDAIIDALLDLSAVLPINDHDKVTISASGFPTNGVNPLYPDSNRKLVVTIKGSDLLEFRQGKISKEDAKSRIKETRY